MYWINNKCLPVRGDRHTGCMDEDVCEYQVKDDFWEGVLNKSSWAGCLEIKRERRMYNGRVPGSGRMGERTGERACERE